MTDVLGSFTFLPWLRRGISTQLTRIDDGSVPAAAQPRGTVEVTVPFDGPGAEPVVVRDVPLIGPGEVSGLDAGAVVRVWPADGAPDVESNLFPVLEFGQPDVPWRFTPAAATLGDRLRPWCVLAALSEDDGELLALRPAGPERRLAVATIAPSAPLPPLEQSWAWAHVEVVGATPGEEELSRILRQTPRHAIGRLLCPRRLKPATRYTVLLVPAFARGRLAGMGTPPGPDVDGLAPAWPAGPRQEPLELPVYHRWSFITGPGGDFEALVDRLQKMPLPPEVGRRNLDVTRPGSGLPAASATPLAVEGALRSDAMTPSAWDPGEREAWLQALSGLLTEPERLVAGAPGTARRVALPWYGRWHAALRSLAIDAAAAPPGPWTAELNGDPRLRVAAALGAMVVRERQQQLMAGAWAQAPGIRRVNAELLLAQLAREQAGRIHARHLATGDAEDVLMLTAPVHGRIRETPVAGARTVRAALAASPIDPGVFEPQFRRVARPLGPAGRRQGRPGTRPPVGLLSRLNDGLTAAPRPGPPSGLVPFRGPGLNRGTLDPVRIGATAITAGFVPRRVLPGDPAPDDPPAKPAGGPPNPFLDAVVEVCTGLTAPPARPPDRPRVDLPRLADRMLAGLDPAATIGVATGRRVRLGPGLSRPAGLDPLEPVLAAPVFDQPMVYPLLELSAEWLLPGLENVPPNSVSLAVTNRRFLEAYLVGLNHELGGELLWNGFPTDQRGTAFARFWDTSGTVGAGPPAPDIEPITDWPAAGRLGANAPDGAADDGRIVLLLRGDLVRRYPTAVVTMAQAAAGPRFDLAGRELHPVFSGAMPPDVSYFGFELTADAAAGRDGGNGWYLVFLEQPSETRFGLDEADVAKPMATWADLTWAHVSAAGGYLDLATVPAPPTDQANSGWATHGAAMAAITLQRPVRVAVHAARLLPDPGVPVVP